MLDPVTDESLDAAIVHFAGHLDGNFAFWCAQQFPQPTGETHLIGGLGEVMFGRFAGFHWFLPLKLMSLNGPKPTKNRLAETASKPT
jgi:hypothetical protein